MTSKIEKGDGIVFAVPSAKRPLKNQARGVVGYASGKVRKVSDTSISLIDVVGPVTPRGNLPAWVFRRNVIAHTISVGEAQTLAEELNASINEEQAALQELPLRYDQARRKLIAKYNQG